MTSTDPLQLFESWRAEAAPHEPDPWTPVVVSTVGPDGRPSARTVLLKGVDEQGFTFFTNYSSRKGTELAANPWAALVFRFRAPHHRQVTVQGVASRVPEEESDAYFATRPRGSQLGAWASPQSTVIGSRAELEAAVAEVAARWPEGTPVPRPPHWGGFLVAPETMEFWEDRADRLHDRQRFTRAPDGSWRVERLAP